ncbi:transposase [Spirochaetia bacterium]|nr:transposase [Spirochaetia bacterium]
MEDVLDVYQRPYDEKRPVVCLDETCRQLIGEITPPLPTQPGHAAVYDYEYVRNGVADLFMCFEPLAARRFVKVTTTRTKIDFAQCLKDLSDTVYPDADIIVLVMDNLNIHSLASLYAAFPPEEARRLVKRFEIHHTPKHASWLDMAEIEIGIMSRQCLARRIPTIEEMTAQVQAWAADRNTLKGTVHWHFTTRDARIKLQRLYPKI